VAVPSALTVPVPVAGSADALARAATDRVASTATRGSAAVTAWTAVAAGASSGASPSAAAGSATATPTTALRKGRTDGECGDQQRDH